MAKKKLYKCSECGYFSHGWIGRCPQCSKFDTFSEEKADSPSQNSGRLLKVLDLNEINISSIKKIVTGISEFDRVAGGGIVKGSAVLLGGSPGIGKSTLLLKAVENLNNAGEKAVYVTGEESEEQIYERAQRLGLKNINLICETDINSILLTLQSENFSLAVIDSIQTIYDDDLKTQAGPLQLKETTLKLIRYAKKNKTALILIGHITKEGNIAGPKLIEHLVDTVLYFESDPAAGYRIIRCQKNRFGATDEIGVFQMTAFGLQSVLNPSSALIDGSAGLSGCAIGCTLSGRRPLLTEVQSLTTYTPYPNPRRIANGVEFSRFIINLAVIEKLLKLKLYNQDVFLNIAGGIKVKDTALDLALTASVISSVKNIPFGRNTAFIGEVGLSGEVRKVYNLTERVKECERLNVKKIIGPKQKLEFTPKIKYTAIENIKEILKAEEKQC